MPGPEGLNIPGKRNGQTKMVRDGNHISVHSWSEPDGKWSKVGDVVGQPKGKDSSGRGKDGGKITFEGVEYDHVFHIDVDEGIVLKLPYNNGQDPYNVAQDFIHKHELPQDYLQQIADFVIKNSNAPIQWQTGSACDPFTGGNAYVSGSGGVPTSSASSACDPFTGGNAYVSGSGGVTASSFTKKPNGAADPFTGGSAYTTNGDSGDHDFFPQKEFLKFSTVSFIHLPQMIQCTDIL
jgi:phospholipase A-2-activating protein